jgi:hypothetical protein
MMDDQRVARAAAIAAVEQASIIWRGLARNALLEVALSEGDLTSDDVWRLLHEQGVPDPSEPRAMGPVMLAAVRDRWIAPTDRVRIADYPASPNHRRPQRVYLSMMDREP